MILDPSSGGMTRLYCTVVSVRRQRIRKVPPAWFVAAPATDVVDSDDSIRITKTIDDLPVIETPGGIPVDAQQRVIAAAFVQVTQRVAAGLEIFRLVRK